MSPSQPPRPSQPPPKSSYPPPGLPIAIGCDHAALELKLQLRAVLEQRGERVHDVGTHDEASCDYPDFAHMLAKGVASGTYDRGVLVCGTGIGMSISANRHRGVRAAVCSDTFSARMTRMHNDANVICVGSRVVGAGLARDIVELFLKTEFEGGRHQKRIDKIDA